MACYGYPKYLAQAGVYTRTQPVYLHVAIFEKSLLAEISPCNNIGTLMPPVESLVVTNMTTRLRNPEFTFIGVYRS